MTKPKLSTKTPDEADLNSWIGGHDALMERPRERRFAVIEYTVAERRLPTDGDSYPILKLLHIEDVQGAHLEKVLAARDKAFTERTGNKTVPQPDPELEGLALDDSV